PQRALQLPPAQAAQVWTAHLPAPRPSLAARRDLSSTTAAGI
ncbi:hypothetical protein AK812_SmicGene48050, partial [Symbiodinium microadriaticum]